MLTQAPVVVSVRIAWRKSDCAPNPVLEGLPAICVPTARDPLAPLDIRKAEFTKLTAGSSAPVPLVAVPSVTFTVRLVTALCRSRTVKPDSVPGQS